MSEPRNGPKRYDMVTNYRCGQSVDELEPSDDGEWVRFEDVDPSVPLSAIRALVQQWREKRSEYEAVADDAATRDKWKAVHFYRALAFKECADQLAALCPPAPAEEDR